MEISLWIYEAAVNRYAPLSVESSVVNTVTVSGNGITAVQAEETIQAESAPVLMITKSVESGSGDRERNVDLYLPDPEYR